MEKLTRLILSFEGFIPILLIGWILNIMNVILILYCTLVGMILIYSFLLGHEECMKHGRR